MLAQLLRRDRIGRSDEVAGRPEAAPASPEAPVTQSEPPHEAYQDHVVSLADSVLRPQSFIDPLYGDVRAMAETLGTATDLQNAIQQAFEAGKTAEETALSVMLKGLDYRAQIEAATKRNEQRGAHQ
jgi:hypothetical protein